MIDYAELSRRISAQRGEFWPTCLKCYQSEKAHSGEFASTRVSWATCESFQPRPKAWHESDALAFKLLVDLTRRSGCNPISAMIDIVQCWQRSCGEIVNLHQGILATYARVHGIEIPEVQDERSGAL